MGIALPAQGFSFARFKVDDYNRAAFMACRAIAEQRSTGRAPLVLRGAAGTGKTHLLCATAQMLRGQRPEAILALVMPHALPDRVRALAEDPGPLGAGRPAVLLIDELERFGETPAALCEAAEQFRAHGHAVVVATRVAPHRLQALDAHFRAFLQGGEVLSLGMPENEPEDAQPAEAARHELAIEAARAVADWTPPQRSASPETVSALRREVAGLRRERDQLEAQLAERAGQHAELREVRARLEEARAAQRKAESAAHDAQQATGQAVAEEAQRWQARLDAATQAQAALRQELHAAQAAQHALQQQVAEQAASREQAARLQEALAEARAEQGGIRAALSDVRNQLGEALHALEAAHAERDAARRALDAAPAALPPLAERLQRLCEAAAPVDFAPLLARADALAERAAAGAGSGGDEALAVALAQQRAEAEEAERQLEAARHALGRERVQGSQLQGRVRSLELDLVRTQKQLALQAAELDAQRHAAAGEAAQASLRGRDLARECEHLRAALEVSEAALQAATEALEQAGARANESAQAVRLRVAQVRAAQASRADAGSSAPAAQAALFEERELQHLWREATADDE